MTKSRSHFFYIAISLCISVFTGCKTEDKTNNESNSDSLAVSASDSASRDSLAVATALLNFNNTVDSIYQGSAKMILSALVAGNERMKQNTGFMMDAQIPIPDTLTRRKPFLLLTDIDLTQSPEKIFDMKESMFIQMASPACLINQKQIAVMEYAVNYSGTKVIVILANGASRIIGAACDRVQTDNFAAISQELAKAMNTTQEFADRSSANKSYVSQIAQNQAVISLNQVLAQSPTLKSMEADGRIVIKSALYTADGSVKLLD